MFERYTERARRVLFLARYEAGQAGSVSIEPEHVLLGLLREGKGLTSRVFAEAKLSGDVVRGQFEQRRSTNGSADIPFSGATKDVLRLAAEESDRLLHNHIGTEHLLLGLLRQESSPAARVLHAAGVNLNRVREQIVLVGSRDELDRAPGDARASRDQPLSSSAPSYEIRIARVVSTGGTSMTGGPRSWATTGMTLLDLLARVSEVVPTRIELPDQISGSDRYDIDITVPRDVTPEDMHHILAHAERCGINSSGC
jgi:ATP-dependent Clp protease ATP-binding subunit ClpA